MFRVEVTKPAEDDADEVYNWLRERSPNGATRWWRVFLTTLQELKQNPPAYGRAPESDAFDEPLRLTLFKTRRGRTYRALFVVRDDVVYVLRVRGAGQDIVERSDVELPE